MKAHFYSAILLITTLCCAHAATAQDEDDYSDSLQKVIMRSVQQQLGGHGVSNEYIDSSKLYRVALPDLKQLFKDIREQISEAHSTGDIEGLGKAYRKLSSVDSMNGNYKSAYENYKLYSIYRDSLQRKEIEKKELQAKLQRDFDRKQAAQQLEKEKEARKNSIRQLFMLAFLLVLVTVSISTFVAYKREQKAKKILNVQNQEIEQTLSELKSTQAQLIHAEKMASLGELTAGIAHEIQNPLNFVNNFSEANSELIDELELATHEGNLDEVKQLVGDIRNNEQKIVHHGKRADTIVKSMLQHSRQSASAKEPVNINAMCDEYLRLSYHGLRAKDKTFNATLKTSFDEGVGKVNVVPEELGRVLLNLFNNAFYAVNEKRKETGDGFEPAVYVSTRRSGGNIEVTVRDNGGGIPESVRDKIFQPFFTTKPTGEGTGLGLSLAYDIVTKVHGGTLRIESEEGNGAAFTVVLPV